MPKRILIVDDSPVILKLLRDLLTAEGYLVIGRSESLQELDEVRRANPNLIILDHLQKGIDSSQDILTLMKKSVNLSAVPVIICTVPGHGAAALKEQLRLENVDLLLKPFDIDELFATVKRMIKQAEAKAGASSPPYAAVVVNLRGD